MQAFSRILTIFFIISSLVSCNKFIHKENTNKKRQKITKTRKSTAFSSRTDGVYSSTVSGDNLVATLTSNKVGKLMDKNDKKLAKNTLIRALDSGLSNQSIKWQNPSSGNYGLVTPIANAKHKGKYCRIVIQEIHIHNKTTKVKSKICRKNDRSWTVVRY